MGILKFHSSSIMTMSVIQSYNQTTNEKNTKRRGIVFGWETKRLRSFSSFDVIHWQATVGQTTPEESSDGFGGRMTLVLRKLSFSLLSSTSRNIFAASKALRLPRRSRGCLVRPVLYKWHVKSCISSLYYLIAAKIVCFIPFSFKLVEPSSSTLLANHCLASALQNNARLIEFKECIQTSEFLLCCPPFDWHRS